MHKYIIFKKQSHINKLHDAFIDNNEGEIKGGSNKFFINIGSNLDLSFSLFNLHQKWIFY